MPQQGRRMILTPVVMTALFLFLPFLLFLLALLLSLLLSSCSYRQPLNLI